MNKYVESEQPNTLFKLNKRIRTHHHEVDNDIIVRFDCQRLTEYSKDILESLSHIISDSGDVGRFELDVFDIEIKQIKKLEEGMVNDVFYLGKR